MTTTTENLASSMKWSPKSTRGPEGSRSSEHKRSHSGGEETEGSELERRPTLKASNGNQKYHSLHAFLFSEDYDCADEHGPPRDLGSVATASISQMTMSVASAPFDSPRKGAAKHAKKVRFSPQSVIPDRARRRRIWKSQTNTLDGDSISWSEAIAEDDDEYETIVDNFSEADGRIGMAEGVRRALFHTRLNKIHDFITGNACWSSGVERVKEGCIMNGCIDEPASAEVATTAEMEDYVARDDSLVGEEDPDDEDTALTPGRSVETSLFSQSIGASEFSGFDLMDEKTSGAVEQHQHTQQQSFHTPRRGRSRTARHGYNSDRSHSSISGSSRGSSVSVSSINRELAVLMIPASPVSASGDISVASESVAESVLSQDQQAWLSMTQPQPASPISLPQLDVRTDEAAGEIIAGDLKSGAPGIPGVIKSTALMNKALKRREMLRTKKEHI